ncbi:MAG: lysine biosynthesis protein LysW [Candidatus Dojkabacteria bacterium]|nr:MAG: lysine biosynthesis protein LysW [Candidatus Dojkabacteria bacterium]
MDNTKIVCPECGNEIVLEDKEYSVGEILECSVCGTELEVVSVGQDENGTKKVEVEIIEEEK